MEITNKELPMQTKEEYRTNREAGLRGQGPIYKGQVVGYTDAAKVVQGAYGSRKARRAALRAKA